MAGGGGIDHSILLHRHSTTCSSCMDHPPSSCLQGRGTLEQTRTIIANAPTSTLLILGIHGIHVLQTTSFEAFLTGDHVRSSRRLKHTTARFLIASLPPF